MTNVAVIYYSATGNIARLADAIADGAQAEGAEVRVRRVAETAPAEAIAKNEKWQEFQTSMQSEPVATLDDVEWADGLALGAPTRFGGPASQLKAFLDTTGGLWATGALADKVVTGFTSASTSHGGLESTLLALYNHAYHWGSVVLPIGYTDPVIKATGNPYGSSWVSRKGSSPDDDALATAHYQGTRLARIATRMANGPAA